MRRKSLRGGRAATSTKPPHPTVRAVPFLVSQDEDDAAVPKRSIESNHDLRNVREVGSKDNVDNVIDEGSNRGPHDNLDHEYIYIDLLDRKICISCNEGGEVLVCSERDCPVTVHAKCICCEPKFDDNGNFYCSYCWLKRALAEVQELRNKALIAKKDLSNFLDKEPKELSLVGNGNRLDYCNRQGNDNVRSQPLQTVEDQQKEKEVTASADQHGIPVEGEAQANAQVVNTVDSRHYREEKTPVHNELVHKYTNREKFNVQNISEIYETRFVEGKGGIEPEDPRYNDENVYERIVEDGEEAEPLSASHLEKYTNGDSPDIAFVKEMQESVALSVDNKGGMKDREKVLQNEMKVPATDSSVSETNDSGSEALLVKKRRVKQRAQKYPLRVSSVRKSLPLNSNIDGENACHENEEVVTSKTLRQAKVSSKQGCSKKLTIPTRKRKRLRWTAEEENMLKEGVLRFSTENHNIPWMKILEFGCHVFDNTRTPADLKDKWRNITAKEG